MTHIHIHTEERERESKPSPVSRKDQVQDKKMKYGVL